jgi:cobalt-zinc-cadmium efflux system protein
MTTTSGPGPGIGAMLCAMGGDHSAAQASRDRLRLVFGLTLAVLVIEVVGGVASNSLALLADAGHMLTDVAGIGLALLAIWFAGRPAHGGRTFGYLRLEILAAVVNAVILFGVTAFILFEAWRRLSEPVDIATDLMLAVALVGLVANSVSLYLLRKAQGESLNMRGAYLEVMGDLAGSAAVIVAAVVIAATGWTPADAIASATIALLIIPRTWTLLREAVDVLLEATPKGIDLDVVRSHILDAEGVADVHDLHAWTITSGMNVVSAHVVLDESADPPQVLDELCRCLAGDFDIEHSTFQLESPDRTRLEESAHA